MVFEGMSYDDGWLRGLVSLALAALVLFAVSGPDPWRARLDAAERFNLAHEPRHDNHPQGGSRWLRRVKPSFRLQRWLGAVG